MPDLRLALPRRLALAGMLALCALAAMAQPAERHPGYRKLIAAAQREGVVEVYSTMDAAEAQPLIAEFEALYPEIHVQYSEMNSPEVYGRFISETDSRGSSADV